MMKSALSSVFSAIPTSLLRRSKSKDFSIPLASPSPNGGGTNFLQLQQESLYSSTTSNYGSPSNYESRFASSSSYPGSPGLGGGGSPYATPNKLHLSTSNSNLHSSWGANSPTYSGGGGVPQQQQQQHSTYSPQLQQQQGNHLQMPSLPPSRRNSGSSTDGGLEMSSDALKRRPSGYLNSTEANGGGGGGGLEGGLMSRRGKMT